MLGIAVSSSSPPPHQCNIKAGLLDRGAVVGGASGNAVINECRNRRKSMPFKSVSRNDLSPGILFCIAKEKVKLIGGDLVGNNESNSNTIIGITSSTGGGGTTSRSSMMTIDEWSDCWKIGVVNEKRNGTTNGNNNNMMIGQQRLRSFSLIERLGGSESEGDFSVLAGASPVVSAKRRASISTPAITVYTGSLAHLVPNQFLQTTSRRVSTHGSAPGCSCTSCGSTVTPYWRDGWAADVMLCNACGLRFQKFARRCPACMYIPRKEDSLGDRCVKCNQFWVVGSCL